MTAFFLAALLAFPFTAGAAGPRVPRLGGPWQGRYFYPEKDDQGQAVNRPPVEFSLWFTQSGSGLSGRITELNTFGDKSAAFLKADIREGRVSSDGKIRFLKKYDGTGGQSHGVEYEGALSWDGRGLSGTWKTKGMKGRFEMTAAGETEEAPAPAADAAPAGGGGLTKEEVRRLMAEAMLQAGEEAKGGEHSGKAYSSDVDQPAFRKAERPDDFAVIVGIERYKSLPEAQFARRDAQAVRSHLLALGFPPRHVVTLAGPDATRAALQSYIEEWLPRNVKPGSNVFFYYSGHGAPDAATGEAFLVPWDGDAQFLKSTSYPLSRLYSKLGELKARRVVAAVDACFSGAGGRSVLPKGARPLVTQVKARFPADPRLTVFSASSSDEITGALEEQGHGIFTYYFLKALAGHAGEGGAVPTPRGIFEELQPRVQDAARLQNREQTPVLNGSDEPIFGHDGR